MAKRKNTPEPSGEEVAVVSAPGEEEAEWTPIVRGQKKPDGHRYDRHRPKAVDLYRELCRDAIGDNNLIHRLVLLANGQIGEIKYDRQGNRIYCETPAKDQIKAMEVLFKYGVGEKSEKEVKHTGLVGFFARLEQLPQAELDELLELAKTDRQAFAKQIAATHGAPADD